MSPDELLAAVRLTVFMGRAAAAPAYTDQVIRDELTYQLHTTFEDIVIKARQGNWLQRQIQQTVSGGISYRVTPRACTQGFEKVEISTSSSQWLKLSQIPIADQQNYASGPGSVGTMPVWYTIFGDELELSPTPGDVMPLRITYYLRPSRLVETQTAGEITVAPNASREITVNSIPNRMLPTPTALVTGNLVDVVHPDGTRECALVGAPCTIAGSVITLGGSDSLARVRVGDFVRYQKESDWPAIAEDFDDTLCDLAAVKICTQIGYAPKAAEILPGASAGLIRFASSLRPRAKADPPYIPLSPKSRGYDYWPRRIV